MTANGGPATTCDGIFSPPLTVRDALTVWQFAPLVSAVLALTAAMYLAAGIPGS